MATLREGADRYIGPPAAEVNGSGGGSVQSPFDPTLAIPVEREAPPAASEGTVTFTHESIADGVDDNEFLQSRMGMAPLNPSLYQAQLSAGSPAAPRGSSFFQAPPSSAGPQHSPAAPLISSGSHIKPTLTDKEAYARKIELIWILRRLRGSDPTFQIPKLSDDLYKIELLVEQVRRENACQDGVDNIKFGMMFASGLLESAAGRAPLNRWLSLKGYSKKLMMDIDSDRRYEECFALLSEKYRAKMPSSPEFMLAFLIGQSAFSYSVASQMTDAALGTMNPPSSLPSTFVPPPAPTGPAPAPQPNPEQLAEVMRILQARQMQQVPPIPESPSASSSSGSSLPQKRKRAHSPSKGNTRRKHREEDEDLWESEVSSSISESSLASGSSSASSASSASSSKESESVAHIDVRRRIPMKLKENRRGETAVSEPVVPVVDVRLPRPQQAVRGRPRGRGRGRGAGRVAMSAPIQEDTPATAADQEPVKAESGEDKEEELDMTAVL